MKTRPSTAARLVSAAIVLLAANYLLVARAVNALIEDQARGVEACRGWSSAGATLSLLTPLSVLLLAAAAVGFAARDVTSPGRKRADFALLVGSLGLVAYALAASAGALPRPARHPCLRSQVVTQTRYVG
jgi:hypothetical protein